MRPSIGIATSYGGTAEVRLPPRKKYFSVLHRDDDVPRTQPVTAKAAGACRLTTHFNLVPRSRVVEIYLGLSHVADHSDHAG